MRTKYKFWAVEYVKNSTKNTFSFDNFDKESFEKFIKEKPTYLEIGPGKGKFITTIATKYPQYNFLVIELNSTVSGQCLKQIDDLGIENVKLINGNFFNLIQYLDNVKFEGMFLNFSDPWPKKRHVKRRLTYDDFLIAYAKAVKLDGLIYFKSDNDGFYEYSREQFERYKFLKIYENLDYKDIDDFDAETEFEAKFKTNGIKIKRLILKNTSDTIKEKID